MHKDFILIENDFNSRAVDTATLPEGEFTWKTPSNIALVKYWGKLDPQIPRNTSVSFTLNNCHTITTMKFKKKLGTTSKIDVYFEGERKESFRPKIETFFSRIEQYCPYLSDYDFEIHSENSFPHSSGIASSASGMGALALCVMSIERGLDVNVSDYYFNHKASFLARLGSGSACRSIKGEIVVWGKHPKVEGSSLLYGVAYPNEVHESFKNYQDTILLVDKGEKQVSSTVGHNLMHDHPFAEERFIQAEENISKITEIFESGDMDAFISLVESEALTLHAMMMTSDPYFILMKPNTLEIINRIWEYRKETGSKVCFTLDAGANVHVLYPESEKEQVNKFIESQLAKYCQNNQYICDEVGSGASAITK